MALYDVDCACLRICPGPMAKCIFVIRQTHQVSILPPSCCLRLNSFFNPLWLWLESTNYRYWKAGTNPSPYLPR